ncbi:MAG TPA: hypothetical protein VLM79_16370 [Kofleriaceae bacterium]|nr:hypothetical protein [Kofleriaceae bacterium]
MTSVAVDAQSTARPEHSRLVAILVYLLRIAARARLAQLIVIGSAIFALAPRPPDERAWTRPVWYLP